MSEYRGFDPRNQYTEDWKNEDIPPVESSHPAFRTPSPIRDIDLPEIDGDPEGANPDELFELPDGTFSRTQPTAHDLLAAEAMLDPADPRTRRDPETGAPTERDAAPYLDEPHYPGDAVDAPSGVIHLDPVKPMPTVMQRHGTPSTEIQKWADVAMWKAPEHTDPQKPKVTIVEATDDPLGLMAVINAQYTGRNLVSRQQVTDAERREAFHAGAVSRLSEQPMEAVRFVINFENVSRAFTHQLVRTRLAGYAQESQRFAVKDNIGDAVKLPPSLAGTLSLDAFLDGCSAAGVDSRKNADQKQQWRNEWDGALEVIAESYAKLVNSGMPAEDARGLLPTNMLTRIHMMVDMKTLLNLAGMRLCTQAQFEWRAVFAELARAFRDYVPERHPQAWQFHLISQRFRPVCFAANRCVMKAKSDRHCSIREQVNAFEAAGIKSDEWESGVPGMARIRPEQWLADPTAARVAPGENR